MQRMRVGLDARLVTPGLGIAHVLAGLTRELVDVVDVVWFGPGGAAPPGVVDRVPLRGMPYPLLDSPVGRRLARRANLDVMHFAGNTGWMRPGPVPVVLTVHDVIYHRHEPRAALRQRVGHAYLRWNTSRAARSADVVVSASQTSALDVARVLGLGAVPVVVGHGIPATAANDQPPASPPYAVALSSRDPRKGVANAIAGWQAGRDDGLQLKVLVGGGLPAELSHLTSDPPAGLQLVPYLPRAEFEHLIAGARALIYPSEDEGFGLPVLEAMALGTPVIGGIALATREVGGAALLCIDPADVSGSIASWLRRLAHEPGLRERVRTAGLQRAAEYSWKKAAAQYVELYELAIESRRRTAIS